MSIHLREEWLGLPWVSLQDGIKTLLGCSYPHPELIGHDLTKVYKDSMHRALMLEALNVELREKGWIHRCPYSMHRNMALV